MLAGCNLSDRQTAVPGRGEYVREASSVVGRHSPEAYWNDLIARYGHALWNNAHSESFRATSGPPSNERTAGVRNVLVALDSSGSMAGRTGGERKIDAAKRAASEFLNVFHRT